MHYNEKYAHASKDARFWTDKNIFKTEIVKSNVKLITFFKVFLNKFLKKTNVEYPSMNFYFRSTIKFARFFIYFFIKKKVLFFYKKFVQLIAVYLNITLNVKIFIIGKKTVTAQFLVNYLCFGFKNKESFNYMLKPIRKVLTNMLHMSYKTKEK